MASERLALGTMMKGRASSRPLRRSRSRSRAPQPQLDLALGLRTLNSRRRPVRRRSRSPSPSAAPGTSRPPGHRAVALDPQVVGLGAVHQVELVLEARAAAAFDGDAQHDRRALGLPDGVQPLSGGGRRRKIGRGHRYRGKPSARHYMSSPGPASQARASFIKEISMIPPPRAPYAEDARLLPGPKDRRAGEPHANAFRPRPRPDHPSPRPSAG